MQNHLLLTAAVTSRSFLTSWPTGEKKNYIAFLYKLNKLHITCIFVRSRCAGRWTLFVCYAVLLYYCRDKWYHSHILNLRSEFPEMSTILLLRLSIMIHWSQNFNANLFCFVCQAALEIVTVVISN